MKKNYRVGIVLSLANVLLLSGCRSAPKPNLETPSPALSSMIEPPRPMTLEEAVASAYRTKENLERDRYRHPLETLTFFGLKPGMAVIEITPSSGWYLEILAPLLGTRGRYVQATGTKANAKLAAWFKLHPDIANQVQNVKFNSPSDMNLGERNSADMVLTFRNFHNFMAQGGAPKVMAEIYRVLKPGGVLGLVDHRARQKSKPDEGYVSEHDVIRLATAAGFKLKDKSEINANPKDSQDYPQGVWTLPPSLKLGDQDRAKYVEIGESDRMTLKFVKPK